MTLKIFEMIETEIQYDAIMKRIDELLKLVNDDTPKNDKDFIELMLLSDIVAAYEDMHYPITKPSLPDVIKLRMFEMEISQLKLSEILGVSPSRVSEYVTGKSEPTLKIAREISRKLKIDASIILGV